MSQARGSDQLLSMPLCLRYSKLKDLTQAVLCLKSFTEAGGVGAGGKVDHG